jgi:ankyrin repeat protein
MAQWSGPMNYSGMHLSCFFGVAKIVDHQLKNGAIADSKGRCGKSPLSTAAEHGHDAVVKMLLARDDVEVNSKDPYGGTPLLRAAANGHEAVVKLLLARDDVGLA